MRLIHRITAKSHLATSFGMTSLTTHQDSIQWAFQKFRNQSRRLNRTIRLQLHVFLVTNLKSLRMNCFSRTFSVITFSMRNLNIAYRILFLIRNYCQSIIPFSLTNLKIFTGITIKKLQLLLNLLIILNVLSCRA